MNNNCYAIISGSTRPQSESRKVEPLILEVLVRNPKEELADSVDFAMINPHYGMRLCG